MLLTVSFFSLLFIAPTVVAWAKLGDDGDQVVEKNGASCFSSTSLPVPSPLIFPEIMRF
jgi:hypothetical protein